MTEDPTIQFGAEAVTQAPEAPLDATWGGFQLLTRVGAGGFGEVFRAWDPNLQREIALKLLLPGALDTEAEYQATLREARALASVKHPNIVSIYGCDRHDGRVGFWTDFIHGKTLASLLITQGAFGYHEAALIGLEVSRALSAVHRANLLHRDIKPENVMREEGGRILLMDFGLSAIPQHTSQIAGTPNYMAPELFRRQPASVASDLYALGVLLYFLVTGQTPARLNGLTTAQAAEACAQRKPLIDLRSDLPEAFLRIVNRAIALDPEERFRSAGEMAEALAASLGASSISRPEPTRVAAPPPPPPPTAFAPVMLGNKELRELEKREKQKNRANRSPWMKYGISAIVLLSIFGRKLPIISLLYGPETSKPAQVKPGGTALSGDDSDDKDQAIQPDPQAGTGKASTDSDIPPGDLRAAVAAREKARDLDPTSYVAWHALADAYSMIPADRAQALRAYRTAILYAELAHKKDPDNAEIAASLAALRADPKLQQLTKSQH